MSKQVDVSDLSKLSQDDILYARDRGLISDTDAEPFLSDEEEDDNEPEDLSEVPYSDWPKRELVAECKTRDLPHSGTVEELANRLTEDDESSDTEE